MNVVRAAMRRHEALAACLVFVAAWLAYGAALAGEFVFDDIHTVSANPALHDLRNLGRYWTDPTAFTAGAGHMYRPVLLTSLACNWALGASAVSLKAGSVLLHATVAVLLFGWLFRLSRALRTSALLAVGFAVHPLASEAVNLVSARSELLAAFGTLLALHAQLSWQRRAGVVVPLLGMLLGTVIACGSKETGVIVPVLCGLQALWGRHGGFDRRALGRAVVGILPLVVVVVVYLVARKLLLGAVAVPLLERAGGDPVSGHGRTLAVQLATMGTLLPRCCWQAMVPWHVTLDPVVRDRTFAEPVVWIGWGSMLALTAAALWPGPSARLRRLGAAIAWGVSLPWIGIPLNMPIAEHRLYGPLLGAAAITAAWLPRLQAVLRLPRRWLPAVVAPALLVAIVLSAQQSLRYRSVVELWRHELAGNALSWRAWWGLGCGLLRDGDARGAVTALAKAHELYPPQPDVLRNYAEALLSVPDAAADPELSLATVRRLLARDANDPWSRTLLAQAHMQYGRRHGDRESFEAAERVVLSCLDVATPKGLVYRIAATARRQLGDLSGALAHLDTSIARGLRSPEVRLDRAALLRDMGRLAEAHRELLVAQREAPGDPMVMGALQGLASPLH